MFCFFLLDMAKLEPPQLVGTPYATDSTKFEYPFPEDPSSYSLSSSTHASLTPPLTSGSTFPTISASASPSLTLPGLIQPWEWSSSSSSTTSSTSSFTPVHPKLKPPSHPPIPPSLVKKRPKWSMNIMGRRKSGGENQPQVDLIESYLIDDGTVPRDDLGRNDY